MANSAFVKCVPVRPWPFQDYKDDERPRTAYFY